MSHHNNVEYVNAKPKINWRMAESTDILFLSFLQERQRWIKHFFLLGRRQLFVCAFGDDFKEEEDFKNFKQKILRILLNVSEN